MRQAQIARAPGDRSARSMGRRVPGRLGWSVAGRADGRLRPGAGDVQGQVGGVLGLIAGGVRLDRTDLQRPVLAAEINAPGEPRLGEIFGQSLPENRNRK